MSHGINRRSFVGRAVAASAGAAMVMGNANDTKADETTSLPKGKILDMEISRLLLGGNLLTHYTHSRDLKYVYNLAKHYNTDEKILETMEVAEANGVNTLTIHNPPQAMELLRRYRRERRGNMQWIICPTAVIEPGMAQYAQQVQQLIDDGTEAIYLWGVRADALVAQGKMDLVAEAVELVKAQGIPSGVGAHDLNVVMACERHGIDADFYIKTLHHHDYPSAKLDYDSMFCDRPDETIQFMKTVKKPWIGFKVMAAGAIPPQNAFQYAFQNGVDFALAGMFDYEIAPDVKIASDVLKNLGTRERPWCA